MSFTNGKEVFHHEFVHDNKMGRVVEFYSLLSSNRGKALLFRATLPVDTESNPYFRKRFDEETLAYIQNLKE